MERPLWVCPTCGQSFVGRNMPHSCQVVDLDEHFSAAGPSVRETFDALLEAVQENGPVTVNATRSRITFQTRMRFGGIDHPRRDHLRANFVLTRPVDHSRLTIEPLTPYYYVHRLRLDLPEDVDDEVRRWYAEAYQVGDQRHLSDEEWLRVPVAGL